MKLLTIDDIATLLNCKKSFAYSLSAQNKIPGKVVLGHRVVRWKESEVIRWIEQLSANGGERIETAQQKPSSLPRMGRADLQSTKPAAASQRLSSPPSAKKQTS